MSKSTHVRTTQAADTVTISLHRFEEMQKELKYFEKLLGRADNTVIITYPGNRDGELQLHTNKSLMDFLDKNVAKALNTVLEDNENVRNQLEEYRQKEATENCVIYHRPEWRKFSWLRQLIGA